MDWFKIMDKNPPENKIIETKCDDGCIIRNIMPLIFHRGIWYTSDRNNYIYHKPTHWRVVDK